MPLFAGMTASSAGPVPQELSRSRRLNSVMARRLQRSAVTTGAICRTATTVFGGGNSYTRGNVRPCVTLACVPVADSIPRLLKLPDVKRTYWKPGLDGGTISATSSALPSGIPSTERRRQLPGMQ